MLASLPAWGQKGRVFRKRLNNLDLTIKAPASFVWKGKRIFVDKSKKYGVELEYGGVKVTANRAAYDLNKQVIELSDGFKGEFEQYRIEGDYFRINPRTGNYAGYDVRFGYLTAYLQAGEFSSHKNTITVQNMTMSPFHHALIGLDTARLEIYPGYRIARGNTLRLFRLPLYYIPLYFEEGRRAYFDLPFPAFEAKKDVFKGNRGSIHTHYVISPTLYGDLSLHVSDTGGGGLQVQQIGRLNDHHQVELKVLGWERDPAQASAAYEFQLFGNPRRPGQKLTFKEEHELETRIAGIIPWVIFHADYTANEQVKRSVIDRYPDLSLTGKMNGLLYDHTYTFSPSIHQGRIKEKRIFLEGAAAPQDVNRDYERVKGNLNFSYYLETPMMRPFVKKMLMELNYEHSEYTPGSSTRGRVAGAFTVRRPIWEFLGLYYGATLTKILLDYGVSPFYFEEYGRLKDSGVLDLYLQTDLFIAGNEVTYDFTAWAPYNEIYYLGLRLNGNYAVLRFDRRQETWEFAFMGQKGEAF